MARSANLLVNKRSGRVGSYGLVLENLLTSKGQHFHPSNSTIKSHDNKKDHTHGGAGAAGTGGGSLGSPSAAHSSILNSSSSVISSAVAHNKEHTQATMGLSTKNLNHTASSIDNGQHHSRASSPDN